MRTAADDDFMMVPLDVVTTVGRVAVAGGALEHEAHQILLALGGDPGDLGFSGVVRRVESVVRETFPADACVEPGAVASWCIAARAAMHSRNRVLHSTYVYRADDLGEAGVQWVAVAAHLRSGEVRPHDLEALNALVDRLGQLVEDGRAIWLAFLPQTGENAHTKPFLARWERRHLDDALRGRDDAAPAGD